MSELSKKEAVKKELPMMENLVEQALACDEDKPDSELVSIVAKIEEIRKLLARYDDRSELDDYGTKSILFLSKQIRTQAHGVVEHMAVRYKAKIERPREPSILSDEEVFRLHGSEVFRLLTLLERSATQIVSRLYWVG